MNFILTGGTTNLNFILDGEDVGQYTNYVTPGFEAFNVTVYSNSNLPPADSDADGKYNLTITTESAASFDFAIFTYVAER